MNSCKSLSLLALLVFALALPCQTAAATKPLHQDANLQGEVRQFRRWTVGCSNLRRCAAIVPLNQPSVLDPPHYLQMNWSGVFNVGDGFSIMREGKEIVALPQESSQQLMQDLRKSDEREVVDLTYGDLRFAVPRDGFVQVMLALEAWMSRPAVAALSTAPVTPRPASPLKRPVPPPKLVRAAKSCPRNYVRPPVQAWRGANGQTLWHAGCANEGLNTISFWQLTNPPRASAADRRLDGHNGPVTLYNSGFDADTGYLRSSHYFGRHDSYQDDCGFYQAYAWTLDGMKLVEQRSMPQCGNGIGPQGWIVVYRAAILNGSDSGP